ncbi:DNA polymerase [Candidatus Bathyarchaeota archaeon CG07_land_8_20_14_0_80_47_9]|nr:MAG: DNA polymerase [Candidatus Bathyarchaeota archaeon CG07_land_8_20_14_0_80_47_9]
MKLTLWLLDVNSEAKNGQPEIWLWGIDRSGQRVLVIDRNFRDYFYAVIEETANAKKVAEGIAQQQSVSIVKLEVVERKLFGKPVNAVKVYCRNPNDISKCARELRNFEGVKDCLEDDIRYSMRYLIDNNTVPCGWHEIEVTEETNTRKVQVSKVYRAQSFPKLLESTEVSKLKVLGFSTIFYSKEGSPKPDRNPVVMLSVATNSGEERQFLVDEDRNDGPVIEDFVSYVRHFDPDIVVGYGINGQDWPYLIGRCKKLGLRLQVDRAETEPHTSVYGHVSITGRANVDLLDFAGEFSEVKVQTLENLADYLGIMKIENRQIVEDVDYADYWDSREKREILKKFSMDNTRCVMGIAQAVMDFAMQLSNLVSLPLDHVGSAAAGFRVEWFLIKRTHGLGELVPKRIEQPYRPYAGGVVLKPLPGMHGNIAVLDFKSMYPSLMIAYNISPDTYVPPKEPAPKSGVYEAPEVGHHFRKEPVGFYKEVLSYLISVRDEIRSRMKALPPESVEYRVFDARQKAVKVITNASYGYAGWTGARWYVKPVAEAAAAWGRHTILNSIRMAEEAGLRVVYGDTDSIFLNNDVEKIEGLSKKIKKELGLEIKPDKVYVRIFFTEAKKRYAGLLPDGRLDIVGLEVVRGDWANIAKTVQEKVLEIVLKEQSPEKAAEFVQQFVSELRQKRVSFRDLIIWKTLTKPAEEYEVKASHVEAAKMLKEKGWELAVGDKVGYVIVVGSGRLYERVKPYKYASYDEVDLEYYVSKQVVPVATRVLESFGITEEQLLQSAMTQKETRKLSDFFGS